MNVDTEGARFLRRILMADAVVSGASGLALLAAPSLVARLIGVPGATAAVGVTGLLLVAYALGLVSNVRRESPRRAEVIGAVVLNLAWVAGTAVVVAGGWLSTQGNWIVILVADVVLTFAVLEGIALRRMEGAPQGRRAHAV